MSIQNINQQEYQETIQKINLYQQALDEAIQQIENLKFLKLELQELENLDGNEEILAPIANGIFIDAKLNKNKKLKVNVGRGVIIEKTIQETIKLLENQEEQILVNYESIKNKLEEIYSQIQ